MILIIRNSKVFVVILTIFAIFYSFSSPWSNISEGLNLTWYHRIYSLIFFNHVLILLKLRLRSYRYRLSLTRNSILIESIVRIYFLVDQHWLLIIFRYAAPSNTLFFFAQSRMVNYIKIYTFTFICWAIIFEHATALIPRHAWIWV